MNPIEKISAGFYGKLPGLGDFLTRRLPGDFVRPWDAWLRESLASSRSQLGDDWLDIYLTSPLWRFVLGPGLSGQDAWAGVLMPSVDRVGRYFPLTLACPLAVDADLVGVMLGSDWFERAEALVLSGLEDDWELESFELRVLELGLPQAPAQAAGPLSSCPGSRANAWRLMASSPEDLRGACRHLLARALDQMYCSYSLWWSNGSERVAPSFLTCQGLPPPDGFCALLAGDWSARGWWELEVPKNA